MSNKKSSIGMEITEELRQMIYRSILREGGQSALAQKIGVARSNINHWQIKDYSRKRYISWTMWPQVREYLVEHGEINLDDSRYMLYAKQIVLADEKGEYLTDNEKRILKKYRQLDEMLQKVAEDTINSLLNATCKKTESLKDTEIEAK